MRDHTKLRAFVLADAVARETVNLPLAALFSYDSINIRKIKGEGRSNIH